MKVKDFKSFNSILDYEVIDRDINIMGNDCLTVRDKQGKKWIIEVYEVGV